MNHALKKPEQAAPVEGMGCTILYYSDREPATVIRVSESGKTAWVQRDLYRRVDSNGMSECQSYIFLPNPQGQIFKVTLRKDGTWKVSGESMLVRFGDRSKYHDYSF